MTTVTDEPVWRQRFRRISSPVQEIRFPDTNGDGPAQDEEWCEAVIDGQSHRIRFHDYDKVFEVPGLYEELFYENLKCCSPSRVAQLLEEVLAESEDDTSDLRILDVGAGNGMVGDELRHRGAEAVVGVDIIPEAKEATFRDRPEVYDDYLVADLTDLQERQEESIRRVKLNTLTTVAALGFGDIPAAAFLKALDLIQTPGWVAFNIKEDFLLERDTSGFCQLVRELMRDEYLQVQAYRRYQHRLSMSGEPLFYVGMVAKKLRDLPNELMEAWCND